MNPEEQHAAETVIETAHLNHTIDVVGAALQKETTELLKKEEDLITLRHNMYEDTAHYAGDFDKMSEIAQRLTPLEVQTYDYEAANRMVDLRKRMLHAPYFARIDFNTDDFGAEVIYIGLGNLQDDDDITFLVYDWRAPIASVFYQFELGAAHYEAPVGTITGEISLKRQYEIQHGKLLYFFDSGVHIVDDMLKKVLSGAASPKMKTIVETIQREQDVVIRDMENDLVIVQGVAGSGKTSIALHRVAFLMYQGLAAKLETNQVLLISPNNLFGSYIANVLPELGEKSIATMTFEDIFDVVFEGTIPLATRNETLETIITAADNEEKELLKASLSFKTSSAFLTLMQRFLDYYERKMLVFADVYYNGKLLASRELLKARLLHSRKNNLPLQPRMTFIETRLSDEINAGRNERLKALERFVREKTEHPFEEKSFARLLSLKQSAVLSKQIQRFTRLDIPALYGLLFADWERFLRLSKGLLLPSHMRAIFERTKTRLCSKRMDYEDAVGLLCLKLYTGRVTHFSDMRQVVVDEAQDYAPAHFEAMKHLFPNARFTVLGDINQTIEKTEDLSLYEKLKDTLNKRKSTTILLNKSFRCSYEIHSFSAMFADHLENVESFDRHEALPSLIDAPNEEGLRVALLQELAALREGGIDSIAIICKSMQASVELAAGFAHHPELRLIHPEMKDPPSGMFILPIYMAKGLEFDAVVVYGADAASYHTQEDKKLLYIACTRALHRLSLLYTGEISPLIMQGKR